MKSDEEGEPVAAFTPNYCTFLDDLYTPDHGITQTIVVHAMPTFGYLQQHF